MSEGLKVQDAGERLVVYARGLAAKIAEMPEVAAGLAAAEQARGMVVADANADAMANDLGAVVARTEKAVKRAADEVKSHPKRMVAAVDEIVAPLLAALKDGRAALDAAQLRWKAEQRRIAAEQERARIEAQRKAEAEARQREAERQRLEAEAAAAGAPPPPEPEPEPPPAEEPPVVAPPSLVRTSAGSSTTTKRLTCELVDPAEADPYWIVLANTTTPIAAFKPVMERGDVQTPGIGKAEGVIYRGVRFWYEERIARSAS